MGMRRFLVASSAAFRETARFTGSSLPSLSISGTRPQVERATRRREKLRASGEMIFLTALATAS